MFVYVDSDQGEGVVGGDCLVGVKSGEAFCLHPAPSSTKQSSPDKQPHMPLMLNQQRL